MPVSYLWGYAMASKADIATISSLAPSGAFRGLSAIELGVSRRQLAALRRVGVIERMLPDTYRLTSVARSNALDLRAALLWAGDDAAAAGASAGEVDELENVHASMPEIVVPQSHRGRSSKVRIHRTTSMAVVMPRTYRGVRVTGVEATLVTLGTILSPEALEVACEDARRRRLTSMAALRAYLKHHGKSGRPGVAAMRSLMLKSVRPNLIKRSSTVGCGSTTRPSASAVSLTSTRRYLEESLVRISLS